MLDFCACLALTGAKQPSPGSNCDPTLRSAHSEGGMPHVRPGRTKPCSQGQEQGALGQEILGGFLKEARFQRDLKDGKGQFANTQGISCRQRSVLEGCAKPEWELGPGYPGKEPGGCGCPGRQVGTDRPPDCGRALGTAVSLVGDDGGDSPGGAQETG